MLIAACLYFFAEYLAADNALKKLGTRTKAELSALMAKEREIIRKNTAEQYRSEMILYEKTAKGMQEEKSKLRKLQSRFKP